MRRIISICALVCSGLLLTGLAHAQDAQEGTDIAQDSSPQSSLETENVSMAEMSAGARVQQQIAELVAGGKTPEDATSETLETLSSNEDETLTLGEKDVLISYIGAGVVFFGQLVGGSELFEATMATIEALPDQAVGVITLAVTFFPEEASEIIAAAELTGEITQEDAIAVALAAGADIEDVSAQTAAGGEIAAVPAPLGAGVGAGGAGGGDTTASTN